VLAHREPAGSGFHGAVGVSVQTGAPQPNSHGAVSQNTADTVREQMVQTELTFIVRTFNSVFVLWVQNFLHDGPLNRCTCLTINVYILCTKDNEIM